MGVTLLELWNEKNITGCVPKEVEQFVFRKDVVGTLQEKLWGTKKTKTYQEYLDNFNPKSEALASQKERIQRWKLQS